MGRNWTKGGQDSGEGVRLGNQPKLHLGPKSARLLNFPEPLFPHQANGNDKRACLTDVECGEEIKLNSMDR